MSLVIHFLRKNIVFVISVIIAILIIVYGLLQSSTLANISEKIMKIVGVNFGWLYIVTIATSIVFLVWLALGKYGNIRLGRDDDKPEYSNFSWYAMLFCGGTGIGLVFWSIAEPLSHYVNPPDGIKAGTKTAMNFSIRNSFLHWGITQWTCFAIVGLALAFFQFRKGKRGLCSVLLEPIIGEKNTYGLLGKIIDVFTVIVSFAGVATSLGMGVSQISGGLNFLFGISNNKFTWFVIIFIVTVVFLGSTISGIDRGIKVLSNVNTYIALGLLALVFIIGPKIEIINTLINGFGQHLQYLVVDLFMTNSIGDNAWVLNWRVFYFAWFIAWTPFVGMFIARISKGRTIKEFVIGVVLIPTIFTIIWLSVFGAIAFHVSNLWSIEELKILVASPQTLVFIVFEKYPLSKVISILIICVLTIFFITSADSATYSLSVMTSKGSLNPPKYKKIVWALIESLLAYVLLSAGSIKPLQTISVAASLPFLFIVIAMCPALIKELKKERV